ncbi:MULTISPECIES: NAD(P)H-binding protein [unclassified Streptomyces]|uniref:NAD(P)H-binding protein n=1 Tax=unclassified Streptomyces TaxID=2593676 RepID=UPI00224D9EDA|nr:NAD(P)H-binding protein [Streptomyces sp. NBC_00047]MCX5610158.1 NAD(P)H-binding protein [Streptomyces sp. NBC_00047]
MTTVVVTGATGNVGRQVASELRRRGIPHRALTRNPERATAVLGPGADLAQSARPHRAPPALGGDPFRDFTEVAHRLSTALGRTVEYVAVPDEAALAGMLGAGLLRS